MTKHLSVITVLFAMITAALHAQDPISIAEAKKQEFNSTVTKVAGRVTSAAQLSNVVYIQDRTAGIAVFNEQMRNGVKIGDSVVIENSTLSEFGQTTGAPGTGLTQLGGTGLRFTVVPGTREEPSAKSTTIPNVGEGNEATLVKLRKVRMVETGRFEGNRSYNAIDAFGNDIVIRIDRACEIGVYNLEIPSGDIDIVGVVSQFRGAYQILPRLSQDIGLPPIAVDTVSKSRTLDVTTWNLEWYGSADTAKGQSNKDLQRQRIRIIMDTVQADIFALQEVVTDEALAALSDSLKGSYGRLFATEVTSDQKLAYIYNTKTIKPADNGLAVNGGARAWGNGRFPYRLTLDATIGDVTKRISIFNIHAKATSDSTAADDYERRKTDAETFHQYLKDFYGDQNIIVTGDFNDRLLTTTVDSTLPSCYAVFLNDQDNWYATTADLERQGLSSYIGFNRGFLDHMLISNEIKPLHYRSFVESPERYLTSYSSTVSDHRPVTGRFFLNAITNVNEESPNASNVRISPNPMSTSGMMEIVAQQGGSLRVELADATGTTQLLFNETIAPSIQLVSIPVNELTSGTYLVRTTLNGTVSTKNVVVVK
jgi:endonuclease/exonuclease/phosphatase family metal-dependent hydrolase